VKVLFTRPSFTRDLPWSDLEPALPGWDIDACKPDEVPAHLAGTDVICPLGTAIDRRLIQAGAFGLVQQFGVGIERVDIDAATEHGVWVARIAGESSGNADSVAELAVLHLLALARTLDDSRAIVRDGRWADRTGGTSLLGATVLIVGLGAIGTAVARRLAPFGARLLAIRAHPALGGPAEVTDIAGPGRLPGLLGTADAVVCCAMFSGETAGMFGADAFAAPMPSRRRCLRGDEAGRAVRQRRPGRPGRRGRAPGRPGVRPRRRRGPGRVRSRAARRGLAAAPPPAGGGHAARRRAD
jgi:lactate dehydrogenase-like 2-hydroxyacid dehydrogenase